MGTQMLGMSDAEWRGLTPRLLIARLDQYGEMQKVENMRAGLDVSEPSENEDCEVEGIIDMFRKVRPGA